MRFCPECEELRAQLFVLEILNRDLSRKLEKAEHDRDRYRERLDAVNAALKHKE